MTRERYPFLFGSQYYRAPTPEPECWEADFDNLQTLGFNAVKFFVQWRWSHRAPDRFYFDDLDPLMDLAAEHGLGVTLNFILDVAPVWLYEAHPDARQITNHGRVIEPYAVGHRSVGGHPGPCYRHPGALADRQRFVAAAVDHFRAHPALQMWDVWNEPELCFPQRIPDLETMACYCPHCRGGFLAWLQGKYGELDRLNAVWGRCYETWPQVEMPRGNGTVTDFVDWREFHLDTMTGEARWRLEVVRERDPEHVRYLHVVPNTWFSAVTCADDFAMAEPCEVFAASMNGLPSVALHALSAARGKVCYNVESHLNFGSTDMHQPRVELPRVLADFLPQLGLGIKGFLFWQYRAETLGLESPAWGLVKPDGSSRPVTEAVRRFWATLQPHAEALRQAVPALAPVGVWRSRKNEIFHFCLQGQVNGLNAAMEAWINGLYWDSVPCRVVSGGMLEAGELAGLKLLVMPVGYYLTQAEAEQLDRWVRDGGVVVCEAHLGGYNGTTGRHSRVLPGCGLAESWGLCETDSTSARHLRLGEAQAFDDPALPEDVRKALRDFGATGGTFFPIRMAGGALVWGAHRYAELSGDGLESLGSFDGQVPCLGRKQVGRGTVFYCGTNLGQAAERDPAGLLAILRLAVAAAGIAPTARAELPGTVHADLLADEAGPRFAVVVSRAEREQAVTIGAPSRWRGLFTGVTWKAGAPVTVPAGFADLLTAESAA
ncbi:MAG: beta-galactosidase [Armatimonadetes bacterium]|nr:beta-galactosidase [Armatimonadota bacterium]